MLFECGHQFEGDDLNKCPLCVKPGKFKAKPVRCPVDGYFASRGEYQRWLELKILAAEKIIENLDRQKTYWIESIKQSAVWDFRYTENGVLTVEDYKGYLTAEYKRKRKWFQHDYPEIRFIETKARPKKKARAVGVVKLPPPSRVNVKPLVTVDGVEQEAELVDFGISNNAIVKQLQMITAFPFRVLDPQRQKVVDTLVRAMDNGDDKVQVAAALGMIKLVAVNASVSKSIATDQFQRHMAVQTDQGGQDAKRLALAAMTDEQLESLQDFAGRMGGRVQVEV